MARSGPQSQEEKMRDHSACPCQSLASALGAIARDAGFELNRDDANAALGMCWSPVAVPAEADLGCWSMYARDAFLPTMGQLFGLTIRDIHPPEAARGLNASAEFAQHFDASYRPLICRALEHGQSVLAWQGWPGKFDMSWGIIRAAGEGDVGFVGETFGNGDLSESREPIAFVRPPVQLYVVEEITPRQPDPAELIGLVMRNMETVLSNGLAESVGVVTGPAAYDLWIERIDAATDSGCANAEIAGAHVRLAAATRAGCECGIRFLKRHQEHANASMAQKLPTVIEAMRSVAQELRSAETAAIVASGDRSAQQALAKAAEAMRAIALSS